MKQSRPPKHIRDKADILLGKFRDQTIAPRKTYRKGYLTLTVTPGWRLVSKDRGKSWILLSHADYDKLL